MATTVTCFTYHHLSCRRLTLTCVLHSNLAHIISYLLYPPPEPSLFFLSVCHSHSSTMWLSSVLSQLGGGGVGLIPLHPAPRRTDKNTFLHKQRRWRRLKRMSCTPLHIRMAQHLTAPTAIPHCCISPKPSKLPSYF